MFNFVCVYVIVSACILLGVGVALKKARASGRNVGKVFQPCFEAGIRELPLSQARSVRTHRGVCTYVHTCRETTLHNSYADFEYAYVCTLALYVSSAHRSPHLIPPVQ